MIPNILTTVRLIFVPIFAFLVLGGHPAAAAVVFTLSGVTDIIDGYIARKYQMITDFGKVYDPFVDKLMQITAVVCLVIAEVIPLWILIIVIVKEVSMIVIGGILYLRKIVVHSNWYGKVATVVFYAIVFLFIVWRQMPSVCTYALLVIMIFAMAFSAIAYLVDTIRHYDEKRVKKV